MHSIRSLFVISCVLVLASCVTPKKAPTNNTNNNNGLCGNNVVDPGEQCDDGNTSEHDGCTSVCMIESYCGNGTVEPGEECDDSNFTDGDGCAYDCSLEIGCGNGLLEVGEQCDDDNLVSGDGCTGDCRIEAAAPVCGNGIFEYTEGCDDGNTTDGDGCSAGCEREDGCGDGDLTAFEQCDDGNNISGDGCAYDCIVEFICGNNECDILMGETCTFCPQDCCPLCGNGRLDEGEQCDDDNNVSGDGCSRGCLDEDATPECGNGIWELGEECDDGNLTIHDGCSDVCEKEFTCGDGECTSDMGETCGGCPFDCCPSCGNGVLQSGEQCDTTDLNERTCEFFGFTGGTLGCTNSCDFDFSECTGTGPVCGNGEIEYGETCDGANLDNQDCATRGYLSGTLFCSGCQFNTTGCSGRWMYLMEDFEDDNSAWTIGGSVWAIGQLGTGGPATLPSGSNCAATNLNGPYTASMSWTGDCITTGDIDMTDAVSPVLMFKSWWYTETGYDGGHVEVFSNGAWEFPATVIPAFNANLGSQTCWAYNDQVWKNHEVDMNPYVDQTIQLRFCFRSDSITQYAGWYIDDIMLVERSYIPLIINNSTTLPNGNVGYPWSVQLSISNGSGNFTFSWLGQHPSWITLNPTTGQLSGNPTAGDIGPSSFGIRVVDNSNPANTAQKTFNLTVVQLVPGLTEDFTGGLPAGWSITGTVWQVGPLGAGGPASCPSGPNCAGTNLSGTYPINMAWDAHCLATSDISLAGLVSPVLFFDSWWYTEVSFDCGRVQVFSNGTWNDHTAVTPAYNKTISSEECWGLNNQAWQEHQVNLAAYAGQTVQVRFCFRSDGSTNYAGWYLDDLEIIDGPSIPIQITNATNLGTVVTGQPFSTQLTVSAGSGSSTFSFVGNAPAWLSLNTASGLLSGTPGAGDVGPATFTVLATDNVNSSNTAQKTFTLQVVSGVWAEDFSGGLPAGWSVSGSVWAAGALGSGGPAACTSGTNCAGTNLSGDYESDMAWDAHCLTTGDISLAGLSTAALSFQSWWETEISYDGGRVQVYSNSAWVNPATVTPAYNATLSLQSCWNFSSMTWGEHTVNLTPYVGQTIQLRFCFRSDISGEYAGWYIDDLMITGN
ncbi:immune inhibitor A [Myxococcota bacterium]|nr:immune inhibitor A [Myxococcota bacterium]